ncbi:MAG: hypothetical protein HOP18_17830 [Deltaproteobacteria bacterium]|nr:hypothetical protein [Deltaproteobacteria bacterium]
MIHCNGIILMSLQCHCEVRNLKLASNISLGRDVAGVHWRSDGIEGMKLGEAVALQVLTHLRTTYPEHFPGFRFTTFAGTTVTV